MTQMEAIRLAIVTSLGNGAFDPSHANKTSSRRGTLAVLGC